MAIAYVHPFQAAQLNPTMIVFCMQILYWLRDLIVHDENESDGFQYKYKFQAPEGESLLAITLEDLIPDFKKIIIELSRNGRSVEDSELHRILGLCPSEEGGVELLEVWGLSQVEGLTIVGRMAVPALANLLGNSVAELLRLTYFGLVENELDDSDETIVLP